MKQTDRGPARSSRHTPKQVLLNEISHGRHFTDFVALIAPHATVTKTRCVPFDLAIMSRIHYLQ